MIDNLSGMNTNNVQYEDFKNSNIGKICKKMNLNRSQILEDSFQREQKKNGLFEKFYNFLKNKTNIGNNTKKAAAAIDNYKECNISRQDAENEIKKYRTSQKNSEQALCDTLSMTAGVATYFGTFNLLKKVKGIIDINKFEIITDFISNATNKNVATKVGDVIKNFGRNKMIAVAAISAASTAGIVKSIAGKINRSSSKEFKTDKSMSKEEKKAIRKAKNKENRKNFWSGALFGAETGLIGIAGGIVGIPAILATSILMRYNRSKDKDEKFTLKGVANQFKENPVLNIMAPVLMALPMIKKGNFSKVLEKNSDKVVTKLKEAVLDTPFKDSKDTATRLYEMLMESKGVKEILERADVSSAEKARALIKENVFAAKYAQGTTKYGELSTILKQDCPSTRDLKQASEYIANTFGDKYEVTKQLGVGTVAEAYLARNTKTNEEVCIKILKEGITEAKIERDYKQFVDLIKSQVKDPKEQEYLLRNLEDIANGVREEVNFTNEMNRAKDLVQYTKEANIVTPVEIKDNIYVMQKAKGISLETLQEAIQLEEKIKMLKKMGSS